MRTGRRRFVSILHYHFTLSHSCLYLHSTTISHCHTVVYACVPLSLLGCALGANTYWSMAFRVYTPLPFHTVTQLFMPVFHYRFTLAHSCLYLHSTTISHCHTVVYACVPLSLLGCALVANAYWSTAFRVYTPLPFHTITVVYTYTPLPFHTVTQLFMPVFHYHCVRLCSGC